MSSGWVKLHRKITEWGWYSDSQTVHMFVHLLLKAQHSPTEWRGQKLNPGQFVSGRKQLSAETGISEQSVRTVLNRLKSTNELTIESTKAFSIFTLNSWHIYQCDINTQPTNQPTNQPTINQRSTNDQPTINHMQECKEGNNETNTPIQELQISEKLQGIVFNAFGGPASTNILKWIESHSEEWIIKAIQKAEATNKCSIPYVGAILSGWAKDGYPKEASNANSRSKNGIRQGARSEPDKFEGLRERRLQQMRERRLSAEGVQAPGRDDDSGWCADGGGTKESGTSATTELS